MVLTLLSCAARFVIVQPVVGQVIRETLCRGRVIVYHLIRTTSPIREFHIPATSFIRDFHGQPGFRTEFHSFLYDKELERSLFVRNDCGRFRIGVHM